MVGGDDSKPIMNPFSALKLWKTNVGKCQCGRGKAQAKKINIRQSKSCNEERDRQRETEIENSHGVREDALPSAVKLIIKD